MKLLSFPTVVTLGKLLLSPLLLPFFLVYLLPVNSLILNCVLAVLFVLLSLTDLMERYWARNFQSLAALGKQLEPIATKLLSCSTFIALLAAHKIYFYWVIILVGRDFFVMGLRLIAYERNITLPVTFVSRIKTIVQYVFLTFVILNPYQAASFCHSWNMIENTLLVVTLALSLFSAQNYFDQFLSRMGSVTSNVEEPIIEEQPSDEHRS